jgi:hypothetical protein
MDCVTWQPEPEDIIMSFTYRLNGTREESLLCATPAHMPRRVDVVDLKDVSDVWKWRYDDMVLTR